MFEFIPTFSSAARIADLSSAGIIFPLKNKRWKIAWLTPTCAQNKKRFIHLWLNRKICSNKRVKRLQANASGKFFSSNTHGHLSKHVFVTGQMIKDTFVLWLSNLPTFHHISPSRRFHCRSRGQLQISWLNSDSEWVKGEPFINTQHFEFGRKLWLLCWWQFSSSTPRITLKTTMKHEWSHNRGQTMET